MCDVAFISSELGLVGNPEEAISILSSKSKFRELQKRIGLFAPKFLVDSEIEEIYSGNCISFPFVIKPDESSGTRSVAIITDSRNYNSITKAIESARTVSRNRKAIAEEYIQMPTESVIEGEIFINHGDILWGGLFNTLRSQNMLMIPMTYVFPLHEEEKRISVLKQALSKAFRSAGIMHGEYNIEMFFTEDDEPFLIELNPRQGGNDLPQYVQKSCGINMSRLLVTTAMGDDGYWNSLQSDERKNHHIIHHMLYPHISGIFKGLEINNSISDHIYQTQINSAIGNKVEKAYDGSYDIGFVDLSFTDAEEQMNTAMQIEDLIRIKIEHV